MKKIILLPIILGTVLLTAGIAVTIYAAYKISNSAGAGHIQNSYDIEEEYTAFKASLSTADFEIKVAEDGKTKVECDEKEKQHHEVKVVDKALKITLVDERRWYEKWFDWDFRSMKVTVYVPEKAYEYLDIKTSTGFVKTPDSVSFGTVDAKTSTGAVTIDSDVEEKIQIKTSTGNVYLEGVNTKDVNVKTSTGNITLDRVEATGNINTESSTGSASFNNTTFVNLYSKASTGGCKLSNSIASKHIEIRRSTGSVIFNDSDAETLDIETDTGDVRGTLLTSKIFDVETDTGSKKYPRGSTTGGLCRIKTDTGDINISIKE